MEKKTILVGLMFCITSLPVMAQRGVSVSIRRIPASLEGQVVEGLMPSVVENTTNATLRAAAVTNSVEQVNVQAEGVQAMKSIISNPPEASVVKVPTMLARNGVSERAANIPGAPVGFENPLRLDGVKRAVMAGLVSVQRKEIILQAGEIPLSPAGIDVILNEKTYHKYTEDSSLFGWFLKSAKVARMQDYKKYADAMGDFATFAADLEKFQKEQTQRVKEGTISASQWGVEAFQERLDRVAQQIKDIAENLSMLPPDFLRKSQYLQRAQYYLSALQGGEMPERLPVPIVSRNIAVANFYLTGFLLAQPFVPTQVPNNLRIAVVHEKKKIHDAIRAGANYKDAIGWTVDSFATPEQFLARKDFFLYDVVIGDFEPYEKKDSALLKELVDKGNGGIVILSASEKEPDRWSSSSMEESNRDWVAFAKVSMQEGVDGNLGAFFPAKFGYTFTPKRVFRKIRDAYAAKGGIWGWRPEGKIYTYEYISEIDRPF